MGRHSAPRVTFRKAAVITAASAGLAMALTGTASANPGLGNCADTQRGTNPDVRVCQDHGYGDGYGTGNTSDRRGYDRSSDRLHAIVKVDPLLCVHVIIDPEGDRRLVGTRSCEHRSTPVVVQPCPPCPPGTPQGVTCPTPAPAPVPVPAPVAPAAPVTGPASPPESGSTTPVSSSPVEEAPTPTTVSGGPVVTH